MALSVGSVGDRDDNALADCVISLFRTEVINPLGPWRTVRDVDYETVRRIDCYTNRRLLTPSATSQPLKPRRPASPIPKPSTKPPDR